MVYYTYLKSKDNVMKIKIIISTFGVVKSVFADDSTNTFIIGDNHILKGADGFIRSAINIVKNWKDNKVAFNEEEHDVYYKIAFDNGNYLRKIEGYGEFPADFAKLTDLIFSYDDPILYNTQKVLLGNKKGAFNLG